KRESSGAGLENRGFCKLAFYRGHKKGRILPLELRPVARERTSRNGSSAGGGGNKRNQDSVCQNRTGFFPGRPLPGFGVSCRRRGRVCSGRDRAELEMGRGREIGG